MLDRTANGASGSSLPNAFEAEAIAKRVRDYWIDQGYLGIKTWIDYIPASHVRGDYHAAGYGVRSNIGPKGFPPRQ